jgi:hypothetical protein
VADNSRAPDSGGTGEQLIKSATERQDPIGGDYLSWDRLGPFVVGPNIATFIH